MLPPNGTRVRAKTYASEEYDRPAKEVVGELRKREVPALGYTQCWVGDDQVDPDTVQEEAEEDIQLVTVHRGGKTFQERRQKAKPKLDTEHIPEGMRAKAVAVAKKVLFHVNTLIVRASPGAHKVAAALGVVLDTPDDLKKFAYNPSHVGHAAQGDFVQAGMQNAFGVGVSGHIVAAVASRAIAHAIAYAKKALGHAPAGEEVDPGVMEFADILHSMYATIMKELGLDGEVPSTEAIAEAIAALL